MSQIIGRQREGNLSSRGLSFYPVASNRGHELDALSSGLSIGARMAPAIIFQVQAACDDANERN